MDFDLIFVLGLVLVAFSIPSFVSAFADWRWPRMAVIMLVVGGCAIAYAAQENPGVYATNNVDDIIVGVVGRYIN